jgi:amino acid permease
LLNNLEGENKHGAFTIIFSVWTSMVGTGAITIPWAFRNSGMVLGVCKP